MAVVATTLAGGIGLMLVLTVGLLAVAAALGVSVSWWRRRHDEPLFAGIEQPAPLELVEPFEELDRGWLQPVPDGAVAEPVPSGSDAAADVRPSRSRRAVAGTGVLVALTVGALADRRGGRPRG